MGAYEDRLDGIISEALKQYKESDGVKRWWQTTVMGNPGTSYFDKKEIHVPEADKLSKILNAGTMGVKVKDKNLLKSLKHLTPEEKEMFRKQVMIHEIDEFKYLEKAMADKIPRVRFSGHGSPMVLFSEHNKLMEMPDKYQNINVLMRMMRAGSGEADLLGAIYQDQLKKSLNYGYGPKISNKEMMVLTKYMYDNLLHGEGLKIMDKIVSKKNITPEEIMELVRKSTKPTIEKTGGLAGSAASTLIRNLLIGALLGIPLGALAGTQSKTASLQSNVAGLIEKIPIQRKPPSKIGRFLANILLSLIGTGGFFAGASATAIPIRNAIAKE
jgi:hypothetical protein